MIDFSLSFDIKKTTELINNSLIKNSVKNLKTVGQNAANQIKEAVQSGYADSSKYGIEQKIDGAPALYETGKLMNNVMTSDIDINNLSDDEISISFNVYMNDGASYKNGKDTSTIASYHEFGIGGNISRPLWKEVDKKHTKDILIKTISKIY